MEVDQETVFPPYRHDHSERNSYTKSCGGQITFKNFRENLVRELITHPKERKVTGSGLSRGRPSPAASQLTRLVVKHSEHWPSNGKINAAVDCVRCRRKQRTRYIRAGSEILVSAWKSAWRNAIHVSTCVVRHKYLCRFRGGMGQFISLYSAERKHLPFK